MSDYRKHKLNWSMFYTSMLWLPCKKPNTIYLVHIFWYFQVNNTINEQVLTFFLAKFGYSGHYVKLSRRRFENIDYHCWDLLEIKGNQPSLNTQSCIKRPSCRRFRFENPFLAYFDPKKFTTNKTIFLHMKT